MRRHRFLFALLLIPFLTLTRPVAAEGLPTPAEKTELSAEDLYLFVPLAEGMARAKSLVVYAGLPHPTKERDRFQQALASSKTIRIDKFAFHQKPLALAAEDVEPLRRLSTAATSYGPYRVGKMCGGFHPDYCLVWKDGDTVYQLLLGFGCGGEATLHGPKAKFNADLHKEASQAFGAILKKYPQPGASKRAKE
jgi:hypothetical protein